MGVLLWSASLSAAPAAPKRSLGSSGGDNLGVGFQTGSPSGVSLKYWFSRRIALQSAVGWRSGGVFQFQLSYLWHDFEVFSVPQGQLPFYVGAGSRVTANDAEWGIHGVVGLSYLPTKLPFDIFLESGPALVLAPRISGDFDAALGARYYFR